MAVAQAADTSVWPHAAAVAEKWNVRWLMGRRMGVSKVCKG